MQSYHYPYPHITTIDNYEILRNISSSHNIKVKLVKDLHSKAIYVCKMLKIRPVLNMNSLRNDFNKEISILRDSCHKNLIKLIDFSECSYYQKKNRHFCECMYYIMEYCDRGSLYTYLETNTHCLGEECVKSLFQQMVSVLSYLHSQGFAHGDIRLENFVMSDPSSVKLIDFGFVQRVDLPSKEFRGSNYYIAPEILENVEYVPGKADVFALGCVLFALVFGCPAFYCASLSDTWYKILCLSPECFWAHYQRRVQREVSGEIKELLQNMLQINPDIRIGVEGILESSWIKDSASI